MISKKKCFGGTSPNALAVGEVDEAAPASNFGSWSLAEAAVAPCKTKAEEGYGHEEPIPAERGELHSRDPL